MTQAAKTTQRLPDFIIGGAPKCGTTSLHFILEQHPKIGIPDEELHYFDADDPITHPDFLQVTSGRLEWYEPGTQQALDWYASRFTDFNDKQLIGEDSTTYLFSAVAAERIKALLPDVRLIFLLRDPVKRAYSQYWHLIRSARLSCSFEDAISKHGSIILGSTYAPHLANYFEVFGRDRVKVMLFEDFLADNQSFINEATAYIGTEDMSLEEARTWFNRTYYPTRPRAQQWLNKAGHLFVQTRYNNHMGQKRDQTTEFWAKMHYRWFRYVNPIFLKAEKPPKMETATSDYLKMHLSQRNSGLSDLLDRDLSAVWAGFENR